MPASRVTASAGTKNPVGSRRPGCLSRTVRVTVSLLSSLALLVVPAPGAAQTVEEEIDQVAQRLEAARAEQLQIIAPEHFERAADELSRARQRYEQGDRIDEIRKALSTAAEELDAAEELREVGDVLLRDALQARADALAAQATEFAVEPWEEAERKIRDAGRDVERGRQNDARERAEEARVLYREAELRAIRVELLGRAERLRSDALRAKVDRYAPASFARADSLLSAAEELLLDDRYEKSGAGALAQAAARGFEHATLVAATVERARQEGDAGIEQVILADEAAVQRIAEALGFEPHFADGLEPVAEQVVAAIRSLYEDRGNLQEELARQEEEVARLLAAVDSLATRLAVTEQREAMVAAQLRERERLEQRLREARALFADDEAEILLSDEQLIVRLYGFTFPVGSAEIRPADYSLLTKVQRVLREFPEAPVTVEGHTDSQGNDDFNQSLSQRRAIAVREYLLANMAMSADRVSAVGYGESRPVASNETAEGRAQNRRIDVVLDLASTPLITGGN